MSFDELTVGELRRALAGGSNEQTIREALETLEADDEQNAQHEKTTAAYELYLSTRAECLRAAVVEAVGEVDRKPWPSEEDRARAKHLAGLEARDAFLDRSPALTFEAWAEAGRPERYEATSPAEKRRARIDRLLHQGGS